MISLLICEALDLTENIAKMSVVLGMRLFINTFHGKNRLSLFPLFYTELYSLATYYTLLVIIPDHTFLHEQTHFLTGVSIGTLPHSSILFAP